MIQLIDRLYRLTLPLTLRTDAQTAHHRFIEALRLADENPAAVWLAETIGRLTAPHDPVYVGGVALPHPFILSAGLVKGDGFTDENAALETISRAQNIIPGWRVIPALVGAVEFGSFTRYPRMGNPGTVMWRDAATQSTQNRIGLRNPGAHAAAEFLRWHPLPPVFGVNIAVSPGVDDPAQEKQEALEAVAAFTSRGITPSWFTLNLSCPNTEDDPRGNQTAYKARDLCGALVDAAGDMPLWVKVGPCLSDAQYGALMTAFAETGVRAVIATNTRPEPTPDGSATAGVGGGALRESAVAAVKALITARGDAPVDVIACGGVLDGECYQTYRKLGAGAVQYYSALIYRSPLAAAIIHRESTA